MSRTPAIRFKGFTDPWEQRKLGELGEFNPKASLPETFEYVDLESVVGTVMIGHRRENRATAPSRAQRLAQTGDIFYQTVRPYQKNNYLYELPDEDFVFSTGYAQIRPSIDSGFLFCLLQQESFVADVLDRCTGTSYPAINANDLADIEVAAPSNIDEQRVIGRSISSLDNLITLHQRKYDQLAVLKKALLDKMFPRDGSAVPEVRFAGFTDPWEQRKLGELATRATAMSDEPSLPRVEYEDINSGQGTLNKDLANKKSSKAGIEFQPGDVLYGKLRPYLMNWLFPQFGGIAVGDFWVLRPTGVDSSYLYRFVQSKRFQYNASISAGSKMPRADWTFVSEDNYLVPSNWEEQRQVGALFSSLENLITLHQRKLELLKNLKAALLDKMFV